MKTVTLARLRSDFTTELDASKGQPIVVTRKGKPVAVVLGVSGAAELKKMGLQSPQSLREILDAARKRVDEGKGVSHEEFWRAVAKRHARRKRSA